MPATCMCCAPVCVQGSAFLHSGQPLVLQLAGEMLQHETAARQAAEAAAAAQAATAALAEQRSAVKEEEQRLFRALLDVRKVRALACVPACCLSPPQPHSACCSCGSNE